MTDVRLATEADLEAIARLFMAIDLHYFGSAVSLDTFVEHVRTRVLPSSCEMAIAMVDGEPVGLATFAVLYPAPGLGGQLFLKDLFTVREARGRGVGEALMHFLADLGVARGCVRLDWTAETDNPAAIAFYDRIGARRVEEKMYFRFDLARGERPRSARSAQRRGTT